jgi:hypothetical protein
MGKVTSIITRYNDDIMTPHVVHRSWKNSFLAQLKMLALELRIMLFGGAYLHLFINKLEA